MNAIYEKQFASQNNREYGLTIDHFAFELAERAVLQPGLCVGAPISIAGFEYCSINDLCFIMHNVGRPPICKLTADSSRR